LMLNIGCGDDTKGDVRLDLFRTGAANILGNAELLPFKDEAFDKVYERNIFEHMPNPGNHLAEVKRVMVKGGTLTLITDNAACLKYYLLGTHTGGYRKHGGVDVHYALFTREHMRNFMRQVGLRATELKLIDTEFHTRFFDKVARLFVPSLSYPRIMLKAVKE
jgi:ubiquinone/menaquinone biosynthesis C-methylase UbiE